MNYAFANPLFLLLLLPLPVLIWFYIRRKVRPGLSYSSFRLLEGYKPSVWVKLNHLLYVFPCLAYVALVVALAKPVGRVSFTEQNRNGINIILAIDTSKSMQQRDFRVGNERANRLQAVKAVVDEFIEKRSNDRMGMVVYGTEAYIQAPLTFDHKLLRFLLERTRIGMAGDTTAIGDAIGVAVKRLEEAPGKSHVIILLTDGENTAGTLSPMLGAKAAAGLGVKVYTVGVGSDLDETTLKSIAENTQGRYFNAKNTKALAEIYSTIDKLETVEMKSKVFTNETPYHQPFLWAALILLCLEALFRLTRFRRLSA